MNYEDFMLRAITEAGRNKYTAKPNPVVGAILVKNNEIISEGYHEKFGENHAEINAIFQAKKKNRPGGMERRDEAVRSWRRLHGWRWN